MILLKIKDKDTRVINGVKFVDGEAKLPDNMKKKALMLKRYWGVEASVLSAPESETDSEPEAEE
jgi:hypothetical protein